MTIVRNSICEFGAVSFDVVSFGVNLPDSLHAFYISLRINDMFYLLNAIANFLDCQMLSIDSS